jgi:hypothetical protein
MLHGGLLAVLSLLQPSDASQLFEQAIDAANHGHVARERELMKELCIKFADSPEAAKALAWLEDSPLESFRTISKSGPPSRRIDVVALAEAFKEGAEQKLFQRYADKAFGYLLESEVFEEYRNYFNTYAAGIASKDNKVDQFGRTYSTALDGKRVGTINQILVSSDRVRHYLAGVPHDDQLALVLVQDDDSCGCGTGGIAVLPHEPLREPTLRVFGPGFAELAPEFSASGYEARGMPPENLWINVSRSSDPKQVPWAHWI